MRFVALSYNSLNNIDMVKNLDGNLGTKWDMLVTPLVGIHGHHLVVEGGTSHMQGKYVREDNIHQFFGLILVITLHMNTPIITEAWHMKVLDAKSME